MLMLELRAHLHAVQGCARAADAVTVCSEAALFRQGSVSLCKELATKFQVLSPQLRIIPGLGILPKELATSPDVLSAELRVRRSAVCVVSEEESSGYSHCTYAGRCMRAHAHRRGMVFTLRQLPEPVARQQPFHAHCSFLSSKGRRNPKRGQKIIIPDFSAGSATSQMLKIYLIPACCQ